MAQEITYKNIEVTNIEELLRHYRKNDFSSPYRSTIPLIELFFRNGAELEKIIPEYKSYTCTFEYKLPVVHGKGFPYCSDLMIYNEENVFCIEAKRSEPVCQNVIAWLYEEKVENRKLVLSGWLELINAKCGTQLEWKDVKKFPYQLIHRFASACKIGQNMAARNIHLFYFFFGSDEETVGYYKKSLSELSELTDKTIEIRTVVFKIEETESFNALEKQWDIRSGKLDLSDDVIQLLIEQKCISVFMDELWYYTLPNAHSRKTFDKVIDIENINEFWNFIKTYQNFSPMGIQSGCLDYYEDLFSKIEDCIIIYKKYGQKLCFVNCDEDSIPKDQKFDVWVFNTNMSEDFFKKDYQKEVNEIEELVQKFNIETCCWNTPSDYSFKTKQAADLIYVLKKLEPPITAD